MKFVKVSSNRYEVKDDEDVVVYTIKRRSHDRYILRLPPCEDATIVFATLTEAKDYVRGIHSVPQTVATERLGWRKYFCMHMKGKRFASREQCNEYMTELAQQWQTLHNA
jgi:hypothetical protein